MEETRGTPQGELKNAYAPEVLDVNGFRFLTKADADKALIDAGKIEYIESHVGYTTSSALRAVYEKSIQNKIFGTPVGWSFLMDIRGRLIKMGVDEAELSPIPMTASFTHEPGVMAETAPEPKTRRRERSEPRPPMLVISAALNVVLVILVIVMFVILNYGETDTMLNYKRNITNRYAQWEQQLKEREQVIRERERELKIENAESQNP